jgi:mannose-6-phosphate isomerase-like protein (cupin superfamily)
MQVRQVVTGHDGKGHAVIARDEQLDAMPIPGIGEIVSLWSADEPATYPDAGNNPAAPALFPPVGGIRFVIASYSPEFDVVASPPTPEVHIEDGDEPGRHRTDTTDFGVILSGNVVLELDDGAEVLLSPGDVVVENGTRHRWRVVGDVPATMAVCLIGAHRL